MPGESGGAGGGVSPRSARSSAGTMRASPLAPSVCAAAARVIGDGVSIAKTAFSGSAASCGRRSSVSTVWSSVSAAPPAPLAARAARNAARKPCGSARS
jgi:hypothetical protein